MNLRIGEAEDGEFGGGVRVADGDGGEDAALRGGFRGVRGGGERDEEQAAVNPLHYSMLTLGYH